jgi:3-hydroxyacyl-CoA dehydrogenase / enoyl-CoA hydratase / 3-hydroxybutyryl-CoA epimerase
MPEQLRHWRLTRDDQQRAWLTLDHADAQANVLSAAVLSELACLVDELEKHAPRSLILQSGKANGFIAGADIKDLQALASNENPEPLLRQSRQLFDRFAALPFPTVALIKGFCLGGGLELALACKYRIAIEDAKTKLGLPEVLLGLHPGWGGTVRLHEHVPLTEAMSLLLTGKTVDARKAKKLGLVHHCVAERHALRAATSVADQGAEPAGRNTLDAILRTSFAKPWIVKKLRADLASKVRPEHYPAPYAMVDLWANASRDTAEQLENETHSFCRLLQSDTSRNLTRVFFLQERLKGLAKEVAFRPRHIHVIGAGIMGGDIAAWCALQGYNVTLQDQSAERIAPAMKRANELFSRRLKESRLVRSAQDRLVPDLNGHGIKRANVIIEAIFENLEAKQNLHAELERLASPDALLASNTSSLPLADIASRLQHPERLVGVHFFNPVAKMQLVEIVRETNTDPTALAHATAFIRAIDRLPLPVKSRPGFLVNRILMPYLTEAVQILSEGIPPEIIDLVALNFGMPMGPAELADTVGLDICLHVGKVLTQHYGGELPSRIEQMVAAGHLGRKTGQGFYRYAKGEMVKNKNAFDGVAPVDISDRLILRLINETAACMREGTVADSDMADAGMIFGAGFAPFRGGPLHYAHQRGKEAVRMRLLELAERYGPRFKPDEYWS